MVIPGPGLPRPTIDVNPDGYARLKTAVKVVAVVAVTTTCSVARAPVVSGPVTCKTTPGRMFHLYAPQTPPICVGATAAGPAAETGVADVTVDCPTTGKTRGKSDRSKIAKK